MACALSRYAGGATRNGEEGKLDYEGFLSPLALERYARYMHKFRKMADGSLRASDNWQQGIPEERYMRSLWRHFMDVWSAHRGCKRATAWEFQAMLCAVIFNACGALHESVRNVRRSREAARLARLNLVRFLKEESRAWLSGRKPLAVKIAEGPRVARSGKRGK